MPRGGRTREEKQRHTHLRLTKGELEVLGMLNLYNREIAERLGTNLRTIEKYVEVLIKRLGGATRTDLMLIGLAEGVIDNPYAKVEK